MGDETEEILAIVYSKGAEAAFIAAVVRSLLTVEASREGASAGDIFRKHLSESLQKLASPKAPHPMADDEREKLRRYYGVFRAFYQDPNRLENLPPDSTKH